MNTRFFLFAAGVLLCATAHATYSQDSGRIVQLYTDSNGAIAVQLDSGFLNAVAAKQCPGGDGSWAGVVTANTTLKATLLMAKSTGSQVVVTTEGCEDGWLKIRDIYVR